MAPKSKTATLNVIIAGDSKGAQRAVKQVEVDASGLTGKLSRMASTAGAFFAGAALVRWGQQAIQTYRSVGGEMVKLQRLTGMTAEQASGLWVAAHASGVSIDKLGTAIGILSSKLNSSAVEKLGIDLRNADGSARPFDAVLGDIMDKFASMENGAEKNLLARTLFGRSGTDLIPLLNKGSKALEEFNAEAKRLGLELNPDDIIQATKNQRAFNLALTSAKVVIGQELLPAVTAFTGFVARNLPPIVGFVARIADAFGALPGPVKAVLAGIVAFGPAAKLLGVLVAPVRMLGQTFKVGKNALEMFQLGLAGVTEKGSGAANAMGGLANSVGGLGSAALLTGGALALIGAAVYQYQQQAAKARAESEAWAAQMDQMASKAASTGKSIQDVFLSDYVLDLASKHRDDFIAMGVNLDELKAKLLAGGKEWDAYAQKMLLAYKGPNGKDGFAPKWLQDLATLDVKLGETEKASKDTADAQDELGVATDGAAAATDGLTSSLGQSTSAFDRANKAVQDRYDRLNKLRSAQDAVASADQDRRSALADLAEAQRAARGDSDEYRDALAGIADAREQVVDAERGVADAQRGALEAQQDLNDARREAAERIRDLAQAAQDARLEEERAALNAEKAKREAARAAADPRLTDLEKKDAILSAKEAQAEAAKATSDRRDAETEAADAAARGVEGDDQVVQAKERVAEANRSVRDAEDRVRDAVRGVAEAQARARQVIQDAKAAVVDATKKAEDATLAEAQAWGDLAAAQGTATDGVQAHRDALAALTADLDPASPLRQRALAMIAELDGILFRAGLIANLPPVQAGQAQLSADRYDRESRGGGDATGPRRAAGATVNVTVQGTPAQQRRALAETAAAALDGAARGGR